MSHSLLFDKLATLKKEHAKTFLHPDNAAIFGNLKHRHQTDTHFLYELLQNANDARATEARFALYSNGFAFCHNAVANGGETFTITDPAAGIDAHGRAIPGYRPGHVNAITNIGRGSKPAQQDANTIGKFGTGFKSVFVLTDTPHIYDRDFAFSIRDLIVPNLLSGEHATPHFPWNRATHPTLFWFPFIADDAGEKAAKLYADINKALADLRYPLLFLPRLCAIEWEVFTEASHQAPRKPTAHGTYLREDITVDASLVNGAVQLITLEQEVRGQHQANDSTHRFLTLSQPAPGRPDLSTVLAFALRPDGTLQTEETFETFCYFSTKEAHDLRFIVQAPWSLGDSRELLRGEDDWNKSLINQAASLLAAALPIFRDLSPFPIQGRPALDALPRPASLLTDDLLRWLPIDRIPLEAAAKRSGVSFLPLQDALTEALKTERILPTSTGQHVKAKHAYLSESEELHLTFAEPQLRQLTGNSKAAWIFPTLNKGNRGYQYDAVRYVLSLLPGGQRKQQYTAPKIAGEFSAAFAAQQTTAWFATLYRFLDTGPGRSLLITGDRPLRYKPFLRLESSTPDEAPIDASAWHEDDTFQVFLPTANTTPGIPTLHSELAADPTLANFREMIGLRQPDLLAILESQILPRYRTRLSVQVTDDEHLDHYRTLVQCWAETAIDKPRRERLCDLLADKSMVRRLGKSGASAWSRPGHIYLPSPELTQYFHATTEVAIVDTKFYEPLHADHGPDQLRQFWLAVGVADIPRVETLWQDASSQDEQEWRAKGWKAVKGQEVADFALDRLIDNILQPTLEWSRTLYGMLLRHLCLDHYLLQRFHSYTYYSVPYEHLSPSGIVKLLQAHEWLYDCDGHLQPTDYFQGNPGRLSADYEQDSEPAKQLLRALGVQDAREALLSQHLSPAELEALRLLTQQLNNGRSAADILAALRATQPSAGLQQPTTAETATATHPGTPRPTSIASLSADYLEQRRKSTEAARLAREQREQDRISSLRNNKQPAPELKEDEPDNDPAATAAERTARARERDQQQADERADTMQYRAELDIALETLSRYSYAWCQKALELESLLSGEMYDAHTEVRVTFASGNLDPIDKKHRTLILRDPARYVPRNIEDRPNLELELSLADGSTKSVLVDIASVKDFTLRVKLAKTLDETGIALASVRRFTIRVASPAFLAETLRTHFNRLNFPPVKDLRADLPAPPRIRFIFGPPGTGKTQHIADKEIRRLMLPRSSEVRILVLTPTNKAADVLTKRLLEPSRDNPRVKAAPSWLVRFGTAADPELDLVPNLVQGPSADLDALRCCTVITTIARFPYATFGPTMPGQSLAAAHWDYIILDEASMIPLVAALNVIYQSPRCQEFIIGGDPLQIPPVVLAPQLAEENIYSLVQLKDFQTRTTQPHQYKVEALETQYRATPPLGELFSQYAYGGLLSHARPLTGTLPNPRPNGHPFQGRKDATFGKLTLADITIIRFPVQAGESILQARRLQQGSQYHPYSGLLTAEIVRHIAQHLNPRPSQDKPFRIGVISPYTAQASLVREVLKQMQLPAEVIDPSENVGTIHGFQGDECDLIFALFSPPEYIALKPRFTPMLEREYILNVAVSRAKDRLVLLVPDEKTRNHDALKELNYLLDLARSNTENLGGTLVDYHADDIERALFGRADYLTDHSFSAGHQTVNVYGPTERRYEIRLSDTAIDVQFNLTAVMNSDR